VIEFLFFEMFYTRVVRMSTQLGVTGYLKSIRQV
jgi:hypothetical protein